MTRVYLSGPINEHDPTGARAWRELAEAYLGPFCELLNPLRGKEGQLDKAAYTPAELRRRDHADIRRADVVLVYFDPQEGYLTWGTASECEYAANLDKAVILVAPETNWAAAQLRAHPWARDQAVRFFNNLPDACEYILKMWR